MFWQGENFEEMLTFGIYLDELDDIHEGRICRLAGPDVDKPVHVLYVDGYVVPEHTTPATSDNVVNISGQHSLQVRQGLPVSRLQGLQAYAYLGRQKTIQQAWEYI